MRYVDTGSRDPLQSLGKWLQDKLVPSLMEIRWQSGFFNAEPLGLFAPTLQQFAEANRLVRALIGSNPPGTQRDAVLTLVEVLGLPRPNVKVGVVQFSQGFFHPKTIHLRRQDGSQCAYVGSANLTGPGVASLHIEAGLTLDTEDGDPAEVLDEIAMAIDAWFSQNRAGLHIVNCAADVHKRTEEGILIVPPPPEPPAPPAIASDQDAGDADPPNNGEGSTGAPRLRPLFTLPVVQTLPAQVQNPPQTPPSTNLPVPGPISSALPVVNQPPFPAHVLFAPGQATPTLGAQALSGRPLPSGAVGVVVRLSGDTNRIFAAEEGTANLSLPIKTIETLRFGRQGRGRYPNRARAEYDLEVRYIGSQTFGIAEPADTNVMPYGYLPGEPGNHDIRMLIPAAVRTLIPDIQRAGMPLPANGEYAFVEWPTFSDPTFRMTFLQPNHALAAQGQQLFTLAASAHQLLGDNGCALPAGVAPAW